MARQLRIEYEGAFYHVTSRGNQKGQIFWDDHDKDRFIKILRRTKERYGYLLHAYVLMGNHYHLLLETPFAKLKQVMQNINTSYTVYINRRHERVGHLFQGRYKAFIVDKENYLLELGRYIHLNPVRAGIVRRPDEYKWSSYRDYLLTMRKEKVTDIDDTLFFFSKKRALAVKRYQEFAEAGIKEESPLKRAVGSILGGEVFREEVSRYVQEVTDKTEVPEVKKIGIKHNIPDIIKAVAQYFRVGEDELLKRKRATGEQRKLAIYLSKIISGGKNVEVGKVFGITIQAVTNVVGDIEKRLEEDGKLSKEIILIKNVLEKKNV